MRKIKLKEYKNTLLYMYMFDEVLKTQCVRGEIIKEELLKKYKVNPSSFRRCKTTELEVGKTIISNLAFYLNMVLIDDDIIDELEDLFNDIYSDMNYKIYHKVNVYINRLDYYIEQNPIIFPLLKLMKLFLYMYSNDDFERFLKQNNKEFNEISKYVKFYNDDMMTIYNLLNLIFCKELTYEMQSQKYSNGLSYSIIALRHKIEGSYFESLYFAKTAKELFIQENNFKRAIYINFTILNDLSLAINYDDYYKLSIEQAHTIRSMLMINEKTESLEYKMALKHVVIASLALKKYKKICKMLENKKEQTISELATLVIAKYKIDNNNFDKWYKNVVLDDNPINDEVKVLNMLVDYLKNPDIKKLILIEESRLLMKSLINIIKNTQ